jgi:hypothetical protein
MVRLSVAHGGFARMIGGLLAQYIAFEDGVEVNGETVLSIVDGSVMKEKALKLLEKHGIINPAPKQWYSQQAWLNAFREIADTIGPRTLHAIGRKIPENAVFPPTINSVQEALAAIDAAFHMNHRNGEIGHYTFEAAGEQAVRMTCNNPYPCDFDRGIIEAMAMRFLPEDSILVTVEHDLDSGCRKLGDEACIYRVTW